MNNKNLRKIWTPTRIVIVVLVLALALSWRVYRLSEKYGESVSTQGNEIGGSYRLVALGEGNVTEGDFRGNWVLVWFFDTHCPKTLCGPVLKTMSDAKKMLTREGIKLAPLAITLDPLHDESDDLKKYALPLGDHVVPLTGSPSMIEKVAREFHAPNELVKGDNDVSYHIPAPRIVIMDPQGRYAGTIDSTAGTEALVTRIHQLAHRG
ncbi:SCO family protein [Asaia prunellae]|uniref:SCO family protein n=1 Tax=Asaia prunellae TaxID=610245 RepID=UPI000470619E|nr:SCO family protein [Asaia prunellae]